MTGPSEKGREPAGEEARGGRAERGREEAAEGEGGRQKRAGTTPVNTVEERSERGEKVDSRRWTSSSWTERMVRTESWRALR